MEKQKQYNLRYLLAKVRTTWGEASDRLRKRANKRNKNRAGRLPTSKQKWKIILSDEVRFRFGKGYYVNWYCNRLWILRFAGWLAEPEGKVNITRGNFRLVFTKLCRQVVRQVFNNNSTVRLFQYILRYCSLHALMQLCQSVHIHNKHFTYWFNVFHLKLGDEWLLTAWLSAQPRLSSDTFKFMQVINKSLLN
jgi:hypothetical protein